MIFLNKFKPSLPLGGEFEKKNFFLGRRVIFKNLQEGTWTGTGAGCPSSVQILPAGIVAPPLAGPRARGTRPAQARAKAGRAGDG